jgi:starvation-inducible DNA-binding protein
MIAQNLKVVLATTFHLYLKAHKFHWNVVGNDFAQQHEFLGNLWEELFSAVDPVAEIIRTRGELAPGSFQEFLELSALEDDVTDVTIGEAMFQSLESDNKIILQVLQDAYQVSESEMSFDISNFIAERITAHRKHGWMLASFLNKQAM